MLSSRPKVAALAFHVFGRSVHPELFQIYRTKQVSRKHYNASIDITRVGHVIQFSTENSTLCEIACSTTQDLPEKRQLLASRFAGKKTRAIDDRKGISYETEYSVENVGAALFATVEKQLSNCSSEHDLLQVFDSNGRFSLGAISFIHVESRVRSLVVQALHTFPDDYAIVKSHTKIQIAR